MIRIRECAMPQSESFDAAIAQSFNESPIINHQSSMDDRSAQAPARSWLASVSVL
jgi:hypothetical protein